MNSPRVITVLKSPVVSAGVSAVAGGAWALVPVGRVHGLPRALLVGVPAVVVAAAMATHQRVGAAPEGEVPLRAAVVVPAAAGGLVAFTHWAALALDHSVEAFLVHRGVRRPRVVMAAVAAVVTPLLIGLDRSADRDGRGSQASACAGAAVPWGTVIPDDEESVLAA